MPCGRGRFVAFGEHSDQRWEVDYPGMRKRLITPILKDALHPDEGWLNLDRAGAVGHIGR